MNTPTLVIGGTEYPLIGVGRRYAKLESTVPTGDALLRIGPVEYRIRITKCKSGLGAKIINYTISGDPKQQWVWAEESYPFACRKCKKRIVGLMVSASKPDGVGACIECVGAPDDGYDHINRNDTAARPESEIRSDQDHRTTEGARRRNGQSGYSGGDGMSPVFRGPK